MVNFVAFPVLNAALQFADSFDAGFLAESFIGSIQNRFGCLATLDKVN